MSTAKRIFQLAQEVAASYDLLNARRVGSGDVYTREVVDHLKSLVIEEFGPGVVNQFLSKANRQAVDFWLEDEQTIIGEHRHQSLLASTADYVYAVTLDLDGGDLACRFEASTKRSGVPIVFFTAAARKEEVSSRGGRIGGLPFLAKPANLPEVIGCIEKHLGKAGQSNVKS